MKNWKTQTFQQHNQRTISLAGHGVRAAEAVLVCTVTFVLSEEGCWGHHGEAPTMTPFIRTFSWSADCRAASTRRDAVRLARLRADHTPLVRAYANQLDTAVDSKCPSRGEGPQAAENWLQPCPNAVALR